jgi:hypothetical protein
MTLSTEDSIKRYLLGLLPEDEQQQVELRLLTESEFSEELLASEEELMELYLADALSAEERAAFERHFLSTPERQRKLRFARTLKRYVHEQTEEVQGERREPGSERRATWEERWRSLWQGRRWATSAAFALLLIALVGGTLWLTRQRAPRTFAPLALSITGGATRGGGEQPQAGKVKLPLNADALRISLALPERAERTASHRVELVDVNGETESLKVEGEDAGTLSVVIPAERLRRGRYALRLYETRRGESERRMEGSYLFTVE